MRIGITDSGVGGLSVCAELEAQLHRSAAGGGLEIFYLNAALRDDYAYNSMASRQKKLEAFDGFLHNVTERYRPDLLYIACNTLSVLFQDPYFQGHRSFPVLGIVESGTEAMLAALREDPVCSLIVFATPTTVGEGTYATRLQDAGVPSGRFVQQACPGLPDAISNDSTGGQAEALLGEFVPAALAQFSRPPERVLAFLGCTHYGYQAGVFERHLRAGVDDVRVINPNLAAAAAITAWIDNNAAARRGSGRHRFRVVSRYAIPSKPLRSLPLYLGEDAPDTLAALRNFTHQPSLFDGARG